MIITADSLEKMLSLILRQCGSDDYEADLVARHLVEANLTGHDSHGAGMVPTYVRNVQSGLLKPGTAAKLVKDGGSILVYDGQRGYGQRIAFEAMNAAIERCREVGLVVMALADCHHMGRIGSYGEQSIAAGLVSLHFVNVVDHPPTVAPFGGRHARYSTNPICMAMPATAQTPAILLDMATSKIAMGKVRVAMNRGETVARDTLLDASGEPSCDPKVMFQQPPGALLPVGAHKGYGLAFFCELLAGVLTGGGTIQPGRQRLGGIVNHMLTFLVDPKRLVDHAWMESEIDAVTRYMKESSDEQGRTVLVAGEPEMICREKRLASGIPIDPVTWEGILQAGAEAGLSLEELGKKVDGGWENALGD